MPFRATFGSPMALDAQLTPMMAQYRRIKSELPPGTLLLFRLGDFYEMFFEDAQLGARVLNLTLTQRQTTPMCGLPYHAAGSYIGRLLRAGHRVAICDQLEDARPGKLVKREVTQILSPGAHFDERMLSAERNNFLAALCRADKGLGLACVDLTTGDFQVTEVAAEAALLAELERLRPAEIILPGESATLADLLGGRRRESAPTPPAESQRALPSAATGFGWVVTRYDDWAFAPETAQFTLRDHFKVAGLDGFGLRDRPAGIGAAGALLHYVTHQLRRDVAHLTRLTFYLPADFLILDATTLRNLEVLEPLHRDAPRETCLFGALNRTVTPMGARRLRAWLSQPLAAVDAIRRRQTAVSAWLAHPEPLDRFRAGLREVRDLERTVSRLSVGTGNARDLVALRTGLEQVPALKALLIAVATAGAAPPAGFRELPIAGLAEAPRADAPPAPGLLAELTVQLGDCPDLVDLITRAIADEPPLAVKEGGMIRDGFDAALDELRGAARGGKDWIAQLQQQEIARTGIASLKVRFNSVFGYYLEVTKANLDKVPPDYVRKQTIANGERFFTPALKEMESRILGAEERAMKLEYDLFLRVREGVLGRLPDIQRTAHALGQLDVLAAFAETARLHGYCRPEVGDDGRLQIRDGRHPVLERAMTDERFVPNDTALSTLTPAVSHPVGEGGCKSGEGAGENRKPQSETRSGAGPSPSDFRQPAASQSPLATRHSPLPQIALITGPNMAGKSTYIRQVALLALLAHTGSFIPAAEARLALVDRIFTRIGASDDLARGQSTFMVEMSETANILNNATARSLIILDEIGRGTSTFDGLSLAWSIVEHLHNQVGARTLFATHYHELTELAGKLPRVKNYNVAVREWNDQVIFLRKIVEGGTDKSYGIQVARLAGVPRSVIDRAKVILRNLEESELTPEGTVRRPARHRAEREKLQQLEPPPQLDLFG